MGRLAVALLLSLGALSAGQAVAGGDERVPPVGNAVVRAECGACHMAFQPAFLPARSWHRLLDGLADHFGEDAGVSADSIAIIRAYMTANAGDVAGRGSAGKYMRWVSPDGAPLRITANPEFRRKHRFPDSVWTDPKVLTRSNCLACHPRADAGVYE
ncbi:diheme cytochrome c [Reyranella sp.]|uniref:diheme cytochrome c n=1 Tax=Reyranella sp. TaxID=1929291 RepID=UPI003BA9FBD7